MPLKFYRKTPIFTFCSQRKANNSNGGVTSKFSFWKKNVWTSSIAMFCPKRIVPSMTRLYFLGYRGNAGRFQLTEDGDWSARLFILLHQKWGFPLRISLVNVTAVSSFQFFVQCKPLKQLFEVQVKVIHFFVFTQ